MAKTPTNELPQSLQKDPIELLTEDYFDEYVEICPIDVHRNLLETNLLSMIFKN